MSLDNTKIAELEKKLSGLYNRCMEVSSMLSLSIDKMYELENDKYHTVLQTLEGTKYLFNTLIMEEIQMLEDGGVTDILKGGNNAK